MELLGGPLTHPFLLLHANVHGFALREGLADTALRIGHRSTDIWAPECSNGAGSP